MFSNLLSKIQNQESNQRGSVTLVLSAVLLVGSLIGSIVLVPKQTNNFDTRQQAYEDATGGFKDECNTTCNTGQTSCTNGKYYECIRYSNLCVPTGVWRYVSDSCPGNVNQNPANNATGTPASTPPTPAPTPSTKTITCYNAKQNCAQITRENVGSNQTCQGLSNSYFGTPKKCQESIKPTETAPAPKPNEGGSGAQTPTPTNPRLALNNCIGAWRDASEVVGPGVCDYRGYFNPENPSVNKQICATPDGGTQNVFTDLKEGENCQITPSVTRQTSTNNAENTNNQTNSQSANSNQQSSTPSQPNSDCGYAKHGEYACLSTTNCVQCWNGTTQQNKDRSLCPSTQTCYQANSPTGFCYRGVSSCDLIGRQTLSNSPDPSCIAPSGSYCGGQVTSAPTPDPKCLNTNGVQALPTCLDSTHLQVCDSNKQLKSVQCLSGRTCNNGGCYTDSQSPDDFLTPTQTPSTETEDTLDVSRRRRTSTSADSESRSNTQTENTDQTSSLTSCNDISFNQAQAKTSYVFRQNQSESVANATPYCSLYGTTYYRCNPLHKIEDNSCRRMSPIEIAAEAGRSVGSLFNNRTNSNSTANSTTQPTEPNTPTPPAICKLPFVSGICNLAGIGQQQTSTETSTEHIYCWYYQPNAVSRTPSCFPQYSQGVCANNSYSIFPTTNPNAEQQCNQSLQEAKSNIEETTNISNPENELIPPEQYPPQSTNTNTPCDTNNPRFRLSSEGTCNPICTFPSTIPVTNNTAPENGFLCTDNTNQTRVQCKLFYKQIDQTCSSMSAIETIGSFGTIIDNTIKALTGNSNNPNIDSTTSANPFCSIPLIGLLCGNKDQSTTPSGQTSELPNTSNQQTASINIPRNSLVILPCNQGRDEEKAYYARTNSTSTRYIGNTCPECEDSNRSVSDVCRHLLVDREQSICTPDRVDNFGKNIVLCRREPSQELLNHELTHSQLQDGAGRALNEFCHKKGISVDDTNYGHINNSEQTSCIGVAELGAQLVSYHEHGEDYSFVLSNGNYNASTRQALDYLISSCNSDEQTVISALLGNPVSYQELLDSDCTPHALVFDRQRPATRNPRSISANTQTFVSTIYDQEIQSIESGQTILNTNTNSNSQ